MALIRIWALAALVAVLGGLLCVGVAQAQTATPTALPPTAETFWRSLASSWCELGPWEDCAITAWDGSSARTVALGRAEICHAYDTGASQSAVWSAWECYEHDTTAQRQQGVEADGIVYVPFRVSVGPSENALRGDRFTFVPPYGTVEQGYYCLAYGQGGNVGSYTQAQGFTAGSDMSGWTVQFSEGSTSDFDSGTMTYQRVWTKNSGYLDSSYVPSFNFSWTAASTFSQANRYLSVFTDAQGCYFWYRLDDSFFSEATPTPTPTPTETLTPVPGATPTDTPTSTPTNTPQPTSMGQFWDWPTPGPTNTPLPDYAATIVANWPTGVPTRNLATIEAALAIMAQTATPVPTATPLSTIEALLGALASTPTVVPSPAVGGFQVGEGAGGDPVLDASWVGGVAATGCLRLTPGFSYTFPEFVKIGPWEFGLAGMGGKTLAVPRWEFCGAIGEIPALTVFGFRFGSWAAALLLVAGMVTAVKIVMGR